MSASFVDIKITRNGTLNRKPEIKYSEWDISVDYEYNKVKQLFKLCKKNLIVLDIFRVILSNFISLAKSKSTLGYVCVDILEKMMNEKDSDLKKPNVLFPQIKINDLTGLYRIIQGDGKPTNAFDYMKSDLEYLSLNSKYDILDITVSNAQDYYDVTLRNLENIVVWLERNTRHFEYPKLKIYMKKKLMKISSYVTRGRQF
jgi:hypothetical protein